VENARFPIPVRKSSGKEGTINAVSIDHDQIEGSFLGTGYQNYTGPYLTVSIYFPLVTFMEFL
jgi:hypothetical protein